MSEEKMRWLDLLSMIKKFNPIAFILIFGLMLICSTILTMNISIQEKIVPLALSGSLYVIVSFFEFYRIEKEKDLEEKVFQRSFSL